MKELINKEKLPRHVAIIMDGNGRWARERGQDRLFGHAEGVESVRTVVETAAELGIEHLTLYAFSTENWLRPKEEVNGLMELLVNTIKREVPTLNKNNISLHVIGDHEKLPVDARTELEEAIAATSANTGLKLIMALSYSSRWEIIEAVKKLASDVEKGSLKANQVTQDCFEHYLSTAAFPDPELMIRTSGEYRISNFLLYQLAYTELYFTETNWPAFRQDDFYKAIVHYQQRERRFGKTGEQIKQDTTI